MVRLDMKCFGVFVVKILVFWGMSCSGDTCSQKNILVTMLKNPQCQFPLGSIFNFSGKKLCFSFGEDRNRSDCCKTEDFDCNVTITPLGGDIYSLILNKDTLSKKDIVVITQPDQNYSCMPSMVYNTTGFILNLHNCLNTGVKNIRLSQNKLDETSSGQDANSCRGLTQKGYNVTIYPNGTINSVLCNQIRTKPSVSITINRTDIVRPEEAEILMKNLSSLLGNSTAATITIGDIKGLITKIPPTNFTSINVGFTTNDDINMLQDDDAGTGFSFLVQIPAEASSMAAKRNGSVAGVLRFPDIYHDDPNNFFFNNEMVGIDMGAEISNLSQTINIEFLNVNKSRKILSCRSWNGTGKNPIWTTDGCHTVENNGTISCQCSHLTFFALLMSPPTTNISSSDFKSLSYITSIGCGLSMFFLAVALFMQFLIRKGKASQATKILMNLFAAMFILNFSFLVNESIANLEIFSVCVATAALMHYTMLATFSWFFIEALHMYINAWRFPAEFKHYMMKIYIAGWATPAIAVIALLSLNKYGCLVIYTNDGGSSKMCWITDPIIHHGVNTGYYAIVFIFTLIIFIITVQQIVVFKPTTAIDKHNISVKKNIFSILCLSLLLGITWAFAFFSYGPLLLPSYYIFTILNSFQGFFLFIYYYCSSRIVGEDKGLMLTQCSKCTLNTPVTPYK